MRSYYKLLEALEGPVLKYKRLTEERSELRARLEDITMRMSCCKGDQSLPEAYDRAATRISLVSWQLAELRSKFSNLGGIQ